LNSNAEQLGEDEHESSVRASWSSVEFDTAHLSNMKVPEKFSDTVLKFLSA